MMVRFALLVGLVALGVVALAGCRKENAAPAPANPVLSPETAAFLDTLEERTFHFFWDLTPPATGLTPDRYPTKSFSSIAGAGFALTAYPIGIERGYVSREAARKRVLDTLRYLWNAPQDTSVSGSIGYKGFFYHFIDPDSGHRFKDVELSTMDTALLFAGVLFCQSYFEKADADEGMIRALAESLYTRADWQWVSPRAPLLGHGWTPEEGFLPYDWGGYNEAMILYLLALGSPTHPIPPEAWSLWTSGHRWGTFEGQEHVGFAPLFGHQYTQVWVDMRGLADATMKSHGIDYFENSRRAVLAQRAYAIENPGGWTGYGEGLWGLSACDGPIDGTFTVAGKAREFHTYWARGASFTHIQDDGTVAPTAAASSIVFAPELALPTVLSMRRTYGDSLFKQYGFVDALNPTFQLEMPVPQGRVMSGVGWFDTDYLAIDQGPILAMVENYRTGLVWKVMRRNPHIARGLRRAGFSGGWLDEQSEHEAKTTLRFWALGREGEVVKDLLPEFERENPDVRVVLQQIPWSAAHEKLLTAYMGKSTPDISQLGNTWVPEFNALRALEPLDAWVSASPSLAESSFFPGIWDTNVLDGTCYGIPWYVDTRVLFYRKDILAQAGYASMPATWSEWRASLETIQRRVGPGHYAIFLPVNEWTQPIIFGLQNGSMLLAENDTRGCFSEPPFRNAFDFYLGLFRSGLAPAMGNNEIANVYQEFARGTFAMWITGPWNLGEFRQRLPAELQDSWGTAALPGPTGPGVSVAGGSSLVLMNASKHKREAWRLLEFLSRPQTQVRFYTLTGDLPARREAWQDTALSLDPKLRAFAEQLGRTVPTPKVPEWEQIATRVLEQADFAVRGGTPPDSVLARLDRQAWMILAKRRWLLTQHSRDMHADRN
jgi:ABC-type glycerol-3-phosphate transport system substrate-binding protein